MLKDNFRIIQKSMNAKRFFNILKIASSYVFSLILKRSVVWGFPPVVMIEPTDVCNLKCPLCPSGNGTLKRAKGFMRLSLFKKIIDEIKEKSFMVVLWNQGEPFLNKDFYEMISYASQNKLFTMTSTNGNVKIDAEKLVQSGLKSLIISLDGATQETYNKYRVNGELSKVIENVKNIVAAKRKLHSKFPILRWQFLVMKHNEHEIEKISKLAKKIGVDKLELKSVQIYSKEDIKNFLPKNPKYRRYKIKGDNFELKFGIKNRCRRIWSEIVINWNGEAAICCFDKDIDYKVGNIEKEKILQIWKNGNYQKMRNRILKNRKSIPMCRNCLEGVKIRIKKTNV